MITELLHFISTTAVFRILFKQLFFVYVCKFIHSLLSHSGKSLLFNVLRENALDGSKEPATAS